MINIKTVLGLVVAASLVLTSAAFAADAKAYRAVGNIQKVSDSMILLRTSSQDLEFTRDAKTKVSGQLAKNAPATVIYIKIAGRPHATEITVKAK